MRKAHEATVRTRRKAERADLEAAASDEAGPAPQPIIIEDVSEWERKAVRALAEADGTALSWLREQIEDPPDAERIRRLIETWPNELADGVPRSSAPTRAPITPTTPIVHARARRSPFEPAKGTEIRAVVCAKPVS